MKVISFIHKENNENIKCKYIALGRIRLTVAIAESKWKGRNEEKKLPVRANKHGLFIGRLAIALNVVG